MTQIEDLVKRLRAPAYWMSGSEEGHEGENDTPREAADALEAQAAQLEALKKALDSATSLARMNDSDGALVSVDNFHLKNGRVLLSALRNAEMK